MPEQPCAFHPDRTTGVTCSRCERPICPLDMIDAPVGIHCPICAGRMREGSLGEAQYRAQVRLEQSKVGRRLRILSMTTAVVAANVVIFALMLSTGRPDAQETLRDFGALVSPLPRAEWWRIFTSMFVHIGLLHLIFNMFALTMFGRAIEERYGKLRFIGLFLASGMLGAGASLAFSAGGLRAGASGGVFGILGAWVAFYLLHRSAPGARAQLQSLFFLIGINVFIGLSAGNIDNAAHMGGLAAGFVIGLGLERAHRTKGPLRYAGVAAFAFVTVAAVTLIGGRLV
jgi:membrane associated rhomboid family serine protease